MSSVAAATSQTSTPAASADETKQRAALAKLLRTYKADINKGQTAQQLASLGKQITVAAKAIGQSVSLPKATQSSPTQGAAPAAPTTPPASPSRSATATPPAGATSASGGGRISLTA